MFLKYFIGGFLSKTLASFDDVITRIPIIAQLTKTRKGRIAFAIGNLIAITVVVFLAWCFSSLLEQIPHTHIITSILIVILAIAIYFDFFEKRETNIIDKQTQEFAQQVSTAKFFRLMLSGFVISFITLIDDALILIPVLLGPPRTDLYAIMGIYASTILQLIIMVYFAKKIESYKHLKEVAIGGLLILAGLTYFQVF